VFGRTDPLVVNTTLRDQSTIILPNPLRERKGNFAPAHGEILSRVHFFIDNQQSAFFFAQTIMERKGQKI
jgi:hypothetical protein